MGKPTGFLEYPRETGPELPPQQRLQNFNEFHLPLSPADQAGRPPAAWTAACPFASRADDGRHDVRLPAA